MEIWWGMQLLLLETAILVFWPDGEAGKKDLKLKTSQPGRLMQSLQEYILNEGNRQPITIELPKVDEQRVLLYLASLEGDMPRYQIARNNCSHVVAKALMEGAKCQPSFVPHAGNYSKLGKILGGGIWAPDQILKFVKELQ